MTAKVLIGSKQKIAETVANIAGDVREAIIFVEDQMDAIIVEAAKADIFDEMKPHTVAAGGVDYSRLTIYSRADKE